MKVASLPSLEVRLDAEKQALVPAAQTPGRLQSQDADTVAARRWRHLKSLYAACKRSSQGVCLDGVFDRSPQTSLSLQTFLVLMMAHFRWPHRDRMDLKLRHLYFAFPGGADNEVDYREIVCCMELLRLHATIQSNAAALLCRFWDVFVGYGGSSIPVGELRTIFAIPALTTTDLKHTEQLLNSSISDVLEQSQTTLEFSKQQSLPRKIPRPLFLQLLDKSNNLVRWWQSLAWQRLSDKMRLSVCHTQEAVSSKMYNKLRADYQESEALQFWRRITMKHMFVEWVRYAEVQLKLQMQERRLLYRKRKLLFAWWLVYTGHHQMKRRRRALGNAIGTFAIKSRIFARMKLFTYSTKKIRGVAHKDERATLNISEGFKHLRIVAATYSQRRALWHWHDVYAWEDRFVITRQHYEMALLSRMITPWAHHTREIVQSNEDELQAIVNQQYLIAEMRKTEEAMAELDAVEKALVERRKAEELELKQQERIELRVRIREKRRQEREEDDELVRQTQRDTRRARVTRELKELHERFDTVWKEKAEQIRSSAMARIQQWLQSPEAQAHLQVEFVKLKRNFYEPPNPDSRAKEAALTDTKNLVAIQIEANLFMRSLELDEAIANIDSTSRGYFSYDEFKLFLRSIGVELPNLQFRQATQSFDRSEDGCITVLSIKQAIANPYNGVKGSVWKLYVDPAHDSLCYHNFETNERVLEHQMTHEKLREILYDNYIGDTRHKTKVAIAQDMKADLKHTLQTYHATRIQRMFHHINARREAEKNRWIIERNEHVRRKAKCRAAVEKIEWRRIGVLYRRFFAKQLRCTWQKVYDAYSALEFYFNFETRISQYTTPHLLERYGDVEHACMWQYVDPSSGDNGYLHLKAGKVLPRKPDGIPLCQHCQTELATRECIQCQSNFCFYCYRDQHFQPFHSYDRHVHSMTGTSSLHMGCHNWREVKMPRCDMCNSQQLLAAQDCLTCGKKFCRPCFRRIHNIPTLQESHIHNLL